MLRDEVRALLEAAKQGDDAKSGQALLFAINHLERGDPLNDIISGLEPFYNKWPDSKQYYFARLKIRQGQVCNGEQRLQELADNGYPPALCKLGTRHLDQKADSQRQDIGREYLQQSAAAGHPIANRNLWVWRARNSLAFLKPFYYLMGMYWLVRWFTQRPKNPY